MSAYDTVARNDRWWVRVYCEIPMDEQFAVMLSLNHEVQFMSPDTAVELATSLLRAAQIAKQSLKVSEVLKGTS